jgi:plasmid stability protein
MIPPMASLRTITVQLPGPVYKRVQQRAARAHRSVEAEIVALASDLASDTSEELSPDFAEAVEGLAVLDDEALWRAARLRVPEEASARLEQLHWKRQSLELDAQESEELARLVHLTERTMLVRAQAARLLHQRGHEALPTLLGE